MYLYIYFSAQSLLNTLKLSESLSVADYFTELLFSFITNQSQKGLAQNLPKLLSYYSKWR